MKAAEEGQLEIMKLLVNKGAECQYQGHIWIYELDWCCS